MKYQPPKGTQDLWNEKFYAYDSIAKTILRVTEQYGFRQIRTPGFEPIEILAKDAGNEVSGQIYTFKDKGGREFGIKSDITPGVTRFVAGNGRPIPKPIKISCYDRVYRYERPQSGRNREVTQVNAEMYGVKSELADAELLACFYQCYIELGLPRVKIQLGFRPFLDRYIRLLGVSKKQIMPVIRLVDKREKITDQEFTKEIIACGVSPNGLKKIKILIGFNGSLEKTLKNAQAIVGGDKQLSKYLQWLNIITNFLKKYGIDDRFQLNLGLARGSEYYTGIIYEAKLPNSQYGSIGGGGRYDNLVAQYGGPDTPAVGFSIGLDRIYPILQETNKLQLTNKPKIDYYLATERDSISITSMIKCVQQLREKGQNVEVDLQNKNMSEQLQAAKELGSKKVILFKQALLKNNQVVLINLIENKEQIIQVSDYDSTIL